MKNVMVILGVVMMIASPVYVGAESKSVTPVTEASPQRVLKHITVKVNGLVCGFCAKGINKRFMSVSGIQSVDVSLTNKTVVLELKPNAVLSDKEIEDTVKSAGYTTVRIDR